MDDWRTLPSIIAPPSDAEEYDVWLAQMQIHRDRARRDLDLDRAPVARAELAWAKQCFVCSKWMTWDRRFLTDGKLDAGKFLADGRKRFGGYDGVVLWQAYPRIGFDSRNQFDFYRELSGGLPHLEKEVRTLRSNQVRTFLAYNPWDVGTRREPVNDGIALRELADAVGADGIFLDTLREGGGELRSPLLDGPRPLGLESELDLPPTALADHALSWMQWPNPPTLLGLLRNAWLSRGHMQHVIRRWHRDHRHELFLAWLNGAGMLVWENVFGSWNGWSPEEAAMIHQMRDVYHAYAEVFAAGAQRPFVPLWPGVVSSEWKTGDEAIWTLANPSSRSVRVHPLSKGLFDAFTGNPVQEPLLIPPYGIAGLATRPRSVENSSPAAERPRPWIRSVPFQRKMLDRVPFGMVEIRAPAGTCSARYRVRECGDYTHANFENQSYPGLHSIQTVSQVLPALHFAIDIEEVTNAQFREFVSETGYRPRLAGGFLAHWQDGKPMPGTEYEPVTHVDLDDARAYAAWKGKRLPTEWEWQIAASLQKIDRGSPMVWNWTESEHTDGITEFVMLKGGCERKVVGSDWYADGGPQEPDFMAKFIRVCPELDRCATIGFRCAADL